MIPARYRSSEDKPINEVLEVGRSERQLLSGADGGRQDLRDRAPLIRLVGLALTEQGDESQDGRRCFRPATVAAIFAVTEHEEVNPALLIAS